MPPQGQPQNVVPFPPRPEGIAPEQSIPPVANPAEQIPPVTVPEAMPQVQQTPEVTPVVPTPEAVVPTPITPEVPAAPAETAAVPAPPAEGINDLEKVEEKIIAGAGQEISIDTKTLLREENSDPNTLGDEMEKRRAEALAKAGFGTSEFTGLDKAA